MKKRKCFLFVFNGYADWEPALAVATLNKFSDFSIHTFSVDGFEVESMGGLKIQPDMSLDEINDAKVDLLILPGGDSWLEGGNKEITILVKKLVARHANIAAICDATTFLAELGLLNRLWHTSNGPDYLVEKVSKYKGKQYYEDLPAVVHENIITANGAGMVEFALEIFKQQRIFDTTTLEKIQDLNIVESNSVEAFTSKIKTLYNDKFGKQPEVYITQIEDGVRLL